MDYMIRNYKGNHMKTYIPKYYKNFKCIAGDCKHSCCIGWEIDIDNETLEFYKNTEGDFGARLKENIAFCEDFAHFILKEDEKCPFLNESGLCDVYINLGKDKLCEICSEHPRFRNFFGEREEVGLGLCCEAAVKLILANDSKFELTEKEDDGAIVCEDEDIEYFLLMRDNIFTILQNREKSLSMRVKEVFSRFDIDFSGVSLFDWIDVFSKLEYMETTLFDMVKRLKETDVSKITLPESFELSYENLLVYFIYRYLSEGLYSGDLKERIVFSVVNVMMIDGFAKLLCKENGKLDFEDFAELVRLYSAEIEYSEDNVLCIMDAINYDLAG